MTTTEDDKVATPPRPSTGALVKGWFRTDRDAGRVGLHRALGYGLVDWFTSGTGGMIGASLLFFFTAFAGISPALASFVIITGRLLFDAVASPLIGRWSDQFVMTRLGQRFGRRRFFLLIGAPMSLSFVLLWVTGPSWWYYIIALVMFEFVFSLITVPWETLPTEMTDDYTQRTKLSSARMWIAGLSSTFVTLIPGMLMERFGSDNPATYLYQGIFYAVTGVVFVWIAYLSTWEKPLTPEALAKIREEKASARRFGDGTRNMIRSFATTLRIKSFRKHLVLYFLTYGAIDAYNTIFLYFGTYSLVEAGMDTSKSYLLMSLSVVGWFTTPVFAAWFIKRGARPMYATGVCTGLFAVLGYGVLYLAQGSMSSATIYTAIITISAVFQVGRSILGYLPWNVFPFMPDLDEIVSKEQRAGMFAGVMNFFRKATMVVITLVIGVVLEWGGLQTDPLSDGSMPSPDTQPASAGAFITGLLVFLIGGMFVVLLWTALTFKLNRRTHAVLLAEMERLRAGGSKDDVDPAVRKTVEDLIGLDYDEYVWTGR